jgi:putative transposase
MRAWEQRINLSRFDLEKQLPDLKEGFPFLKKVNSSALASEIANLDIAYKKFFKGVCRYPIFKKKRDKQSFYNRKWGKIDWDNGLLSVLKIHNIPVVLHRRFAGDIKGITITRKKTGKYFASVMFDDGLGEPKRKEIAEETTIGIDVGVRSFIALSNGDLVTNPRFLQQGEARIKVLQKRADKKQKGSNNQKKANRKTALLHERVTNQRSYFQHNLSKRIVNEFDTICVETLGIQAMMQKPGFGASIADSGFGLFLKQLEYKSKWQGKNFIKIPKYTPSSKVCSNCCYHHNELVPYLIKKWECPKCSAEHDVDVNAANNIKDIALEISGIFDSVVPVEQLTISECKEAGKPYGLTKRTRIGQDDGNRSIEKEVCKSIQATPSPTLDCGSIVRKKGRRLQNKSSKPP